MRDGKALLPKKRKIDVDVSISKLKIYRFLVRPVSDTEKCTTTSTDPVDHSVVDKLSMRRVHTVLWTVYRASDL